MGAEQKAAKRERDRRETVQLAVWGRPTESSRARGEEVRARFYFPAARLVVSPAPTSSSSHADSWTTRQLARVPHPGFWRGAS